MVVWIFDDNHSYNPFKDGFFASTYSTTKIFSHTYFRFLFVGNHGFFMPHFNTFKTYYTQRVIQSQFYNPEQPCSRTSYALFKSKSRRYVRNSDGLNDSEISETSCTDLVSTSGNTETEEYSSSICAESDADRIARGREKNTFAYMKIAANAQL